MTQNHGDYDPTTYRAIDYLRDGHYYPWADEAIDDLCTGRKTFDDDDIEANLEGIACRTADPALLEYLSGYYNAFVREAVAENPACPVRLLAKLTNDEDESVRDLVLEAMRCIPAEQLLELPPELVMGVNRWAELPWVPPHIAERAETCAGTWEGTTRELLAELEGPVQMRPPVPARSFGVRAARLLERFRASLNPRLRQAENPTAGLLELVRASQYVPRRHTYRFTEPVLKALAEAPTAELLAIATNPDTQSWILEAMLGAGIEVFEVVANPSSPELVRLEVAKDRTTPPSLLTILAGHADDALSSVVAKNPSTPPGVVALLATDESRNVRKGAASNPNTPPEVLARLADDTAATVRQCAARNPNTPPEVLTRLTDDNYRTVRLCAAANPNTPIEALEPLLTAELPKMAVARGIAGLPAAARRIANGLVDGWDGSLADLCEIAGILADSDHPQSPAPNASVAEPLCGDPS